jgi:hypothetical protein
MFRKTEGAVISQEVNNELLVLDTESDRIHQLNRTASTIWRLCDASTSTDTIVSTLTRMYDVSRETAEKDVVQTLQQFKDLKLIVDLGPSDATAHAAQE